MIWGGASLEWVAAISGVIAAISGVIAAIYAYKTFQRRPKLKLYIGDESNQVMYDKEVDPSLAIVHATLANVGKMAANNVFGRVEFEKGRVYTEQRIALPGHTPVDQHIIAHNDNWASLNLGSISVSRPEAAEATLHARWFEPSPRHFVIPVRVAKEGKTQLSYWFVSDETSGIKGTVTLYFPKLTSG